MRIMVLIPSTPSYVYHGINTQHNYLCVLNLIECAHLAMFITVVIPSNIQ